MTSPGRSSPSRANGAPNVARRPKISLTPACPGMRGNPQVAGTEHHVLRAGPLHDHHVADPDGGDVEHRHRRARVRWAERRELVGQLVLQPGVEERLGACLLHAGQEVQVPGETEHEDGQQQQPDADRLQDRPLRGAGRAGRGWCRGAPGAGPGRRPARRWPRRRVLARPGRCQPRACPRRRRSQAASPGGRATASTMPERGERAERGLVGMVPGQVHHHPRHRSRGARGGPGAGPGARCRSPGARAAALAEAARLRARRAGARAGGHGLAVLHHAVQRRAQLLARRRERGGLQQDVLPFCMVGLLQLVSVVDRRDVHVPGDLAVLDQPALDQVLRQRRVAELFHRLLAGAQDEVDPGTERRALRVAEVGGLAWCPARGTIR